MFKNLLNEMSSWEFLKNTSLPIIVYGTGNGADRVFAECEKLSIKISGIMASDGFVRKRTFRGFEVKSIAQTENDFEDFVVVLAFASPLPQVIDNVRSLMARRKVVMASVPIYGDEIFNKEFLCLHINEIEAAYNTLADEQSKKVFYNIIRFQITGDLNYCFECESDKDEAFKILNLKNDETFLDLGAYRGDTVEEFLQYAESYSKIVAVEPDIKTYKKLCEHCKDIENTFLLNNAVWSENKTIGFSQEKGRGGNALDGDNAVSAVTLDYINEKYGKFSYINIDIEGAENEMLKSAAKTLEHKPKLCMAVYHRSEDIFLLTNKIYEMNEDYKIYMRHHPHLSFWDTNIYCI